MVGACTGNVCANHDAVDQFNRSHAFAMAADVTLGVGLALIGTAIIVVLTAPRRPPPTVGLRF